MAIIKYGGGPNPPVRLDKWQNIIGVGWPDDEDSAEYLCLRIRIKWTKSGATFSESCEASGADPYPGFVRLAEDSVGKVTYEYESAGAFLYSYSNEAWETGGILYSATGLRDLTSDNEQTFEPWTYPGGGRAASRSSDDEGTTYIRQDGFFVRWDRAPGGSAPEELPLPSPYADQRFDETATPQLFCVSESFTGSPACYRSSDGMSARIQAFCTGYIGSSPAPADYSAPLHSPFDLNMTDVTIEQGGRVWRPIASKVAGFSDGTTTSKDDTNVGYLFLLVAPEPPEEESA
jgi:hypothetical protein